MGPPIAISATTLALTWAMLVLELPLVAGLALAFGSLCQVGWLIDHFNAAGLTLLASLALSPPGLAFAAGVVDGWQAEADGAADLPGAPLTVGPYRAGRALTAAPPARLR